MVMRISKYILTALQNSILFLLLFLLAQPSRAQEIITDENNDTISITTDTITLPQYVPVTLVEEPINKFFQGFSLSADLFGPVQTMTTDYGTLEAALTVNLKNTYFPVFEAGYGQCDHTDENTSISYKTKAPFFRAGINVNMLKNKLQENRLFLGVRYGFSSFNYDVEGPDIHDDIWGGSSSPNHNDISSTCHWGEILLGVQVKIWKYFHMGWSVRMKRTLSVGESEYSKPYYIPGYGTTINSTSWGASYNLIFDLNFGKKKNIKVIPTI